MRVARSISASVGVCAIPWTREVRTTSSMRSASSRHPVLDAAPHAVGGVQDRLPRLRALEAAQVLDAVDPRVLEADPVGHVSHDGQPPRARRRHERRLHLREQALVDLHAVEAGPGHEGHRCLRLLRSLHHRREAPDGWLPVVEGSACEDARPDDLAARDALAVRELIGAAAGVAHRRHAVREVEQREEALLAVDARVGVVHVHVHEAGQEVAAGLRGVARFDGRDAPALDDHAPLRGVSGARVHDRDVLEAGAALGGMERCGRGEQAQDQRPQQDEAHEADPERDPQAPYGDRLAAARTGAVRAPPPWDSRS